MYAVPEECVLLVKETVIDCLAPALGSVHGPYRGEPKLGFNRMEIIGRLTGLPLVLLSIRKPFAGLNPQAAFSCGFFEDIQFEFIIKLLPISSRGDA